MGGIGEGVSEACQEGLPGHEPGSVMFPSTVGVRAWRSTLSVWLLLRVFPTAERGAQKGLDGTGVG